ncbi:MAG: adenylate/guanylate cyclase domain-containing protein [Acidimicrobiia bacterium]
MLTFLFTDIESSTQLWERHPEAMRGALQRHDEILRTAIQESDGVVVKTTGDGVMAVFEDPIDAVAASLLAQHRIQDEPWEETGPLRVRVGIHTGEAQTRADDYFGPTVNRAARIMSAAHGGQVILSGSTRELMDDDAATNLRDMGQHRLKDLAGPEQLFQVIEAGLPDTFPPLVTLDLRPNNLPTLASVFLGRDDELAQLRALLDNDPVRLVTMTGPGGTGKTRLALQAAADNIDRFADGLYFVELAAEREAEAALSAIVRTVGMDSAGEDPPLETLKRGLEPRQMLLLLDNFEQVTEAAIPIAELLASCPRLKVLITSREALNVRGEHVYPVLPLSLPSPGGDPSEIFSSEAVLLLVERASEVRPDFELTTDNGVAVAAICIRLDGLPLPIELAAARLKLFSPQDLLGRLESRLDLLRSGARDLPGRQQTLRGTIEWSYDLLTEEERRLFKLFSVFSGADYSSVEDVAARARALTADEVLDGLESLVDKSLIRSVEAATGSRFSMLETIREYASERLAEDPELAAALHRTHAEHFLELAVDARPGLVGTDREDALAAVAPDVGNLQAAWRYWVGEGELLRLNEFLDPLWTVYDAEGWYHGAIDLTNDLLGLLSLEPETPERVRDEIALQMSLARALMAVRGYTAEVEEAFAKALKLSEDAEDAPQRFPVLRSLASLYLLRGEFDKSAEVGRELLDLATDQSDHSLQVDAHLVLGASLISTDESLDHLDQAISLFEPSRADSERFRLGPISGVAALTASALLLWMLGFPDRSLERSARAARVTEEISHPYSKAYALFHMAFLDLLRQDFESVAGLANELLAMANAYDYQIWRALALVLQGTTKVATGDPDEGVAEVESGMALYQGMATPPVFWPMVQNLRAQAWAMAGEIPKALKLIAATMDDEREPSLGDPENALLRGDLLLRLPQRDTAQAEVWYEHAYEWSKAMGMRMSELQAATRLLSVKRGTEQESAARERLQTIYDTFTEGFDTPNLVAARAALDH